MGIVRVAKNSNYVVMNRTALNDKRLSWKAKGIMAYLLSMPDDWVFYMDELQTHSTDGKASFNSGFKELKDCGYVERKPVREGQRIVRWETIVHEIPTNSLQTDFQEVENQEVDFQEVENQEVDFQEVENRPLLNTDINQVLNKPNTDKKEEKEASPNAFTFYQENGFGFISSYTNDKLTHWINDLSEEIVIFAMQIAVENNKVNWAYVEKILLDWANRGLTTMDKILAARAQFKAQKGGRNHAKPSGNNTHSTGYKADLGF